MYRANTTSDEVIAKEKEELEQQWAENMRINDEWNARVGLEREQLNAIELQKEIELAKERMKKVDQERLAEKQKIDDFIHQQKVSTGFVFLRI